ncbi:hypothetical protein ASZ78_008607 [Callipepla squamata]|uniref:Ras-GAP domain-containing protein n=1 Tax=Callipepla squamata TaxID=9009 RepID=A0A226NEE2_CALSU|nr:hypothetical protein ASZ78_008607 [Callipepla squamata]
MSPQPPQFAAMAKSTSLHCRLVEGKELPAKDVSGSSDPYCVVKVDNEVVARTATVWRSLNPFWGEEFTLRLPSSFHSLTIYVLDEDTIGHDDVIGKVSLSRQQISAQPRGIDSWLSLAPVHPDQEVQGEIHLEVQVIKKTRFPHWNEVLEFELAEDEPGDSVLSVEVWDWDIVGKNDFLGQVKVPLDASRPIEGWFQLLPFPSSTEEPRGQLGSLRLMVRLLEDRVLPQHCYQPLIQLLAEPLRCPGQPAAGTALAVLEEVTSGDCRQDVATKLVKVFLAQGLAVPFLDYIITRELARTMDPNTLFRSNSLASKSVEQFLKAVGLPYLHAVLKPVVNRIFEEKKRISFKGSLSEAQVRDSSLELLQGYLGDTVDAIVGSVDKCPLLMRVAFKQLRRRVEERFPSPQHEEVQYFAISGFLFLRFFAPAVLTPKLFGLREQHAEPRTGRTLLLLAKALQSIGNLGLQPGKESWMAPLHTVLLPSITRVRAFLDSLIDVDSTQGASAGGGGTTKRSHCSQTMATATAGEGMVSVAPFGPLAIIKEGFLHAREAKEHSLLPRFAFKKRYFWLSTQALSYSKSPECQERSCIPVGHIRAVERVDEGTFPQPHVMQVVAQDGTGQLHTTYIQCKVGTSPSQHH